VKELAAKIFILVFVALFIQCAFHGHGAQTAADLPSQGGTALCGPLSESWAKVTIPSQPAPEQSSGEIIPPLRGTYPLWSLVQSIDHPPELPA